MVSSIMMFKIILLINIKDNITDEHTVTFKSGQAPVGNKTGTGRADLYFEDVENDIAYFWEVKPGFIWNLPK